MKMTNSRPVLLLFLFLLALNCNSQQERAELTVIEGTTMGTVYSVKLVPAELSRLQLNSNQIQPAIDNLLEAFNQKVSTYIGDSELSRFNKYSGTDWFPISRELFVILKESVRISKLTEGAFDITVGPLVNLWGFGPEERETLVPEAHDILERLAQTGYQKLSLRESPPSVRKHIPDLYCDLGGIAKGYGVDMIAAYLDSLHLKNYLIDIGGEIKTRGNNHMNKAWKIGISRADESFGIQKIIPLVNQSVATSGDYRNYFEKEGKRYSHTIDPRTGRPIMHRLASVTVVHPSCMMADAMATAIMVKGPDEGYQFALGQELPLFMIVRENDQFKEYLTSEFEKLLQSNQTVE